MLQDIYNTYVSLAKILGDYQAMTKTELANGYCDAVDSGDEFMKDRYFAAIFCRYYYMVTYIYDRRTGNMVTMSFEDCQDIVMDGLLRGLEYRGWRDETQDVSKEVNGAKKVFDRCITTELRRYIKKLEAQKRIPEGEILSLEYEYQGDDGKSTLLDYIEDTRSLDDIEGDLLCRSIVNYYIEKNNYRNAIIVDGICYQGNVLKNLNNISEEYIKYFSNKYTVDNKKLMETCETFSKLSKNE